MSRDPLTRMDVDTRWLYTDHARKLQVAHPAAWPTYWCAYQAVLAESWWKGHRVTLAEAWSPVLPGTIEDAQAALQAAELLDRAGRVTINAWKKWFEPALERIERRSAAGKAGAESRWNKHGERTAEPMRSHSRRNAPRQPATPATPATPEVASEPHLVVVEADAMEAWFRLTGTWPSSKVQPWIEDMAKAHGDAAVEKALAEELIASTDRRTLLSRTDARLKLSAHEAGKRREEADRKAAVREREVVETMPAEQRAANLERLGEMMRSQGLLPNAVNQPDGMNRGLKR